MKLGMLAAALVLSIAGAAPAQTTSQRPRLIVAISVDQLSADLFAQYRRHFTGGLRRLTERAVFPSGYQSHNATETCPGHSTILTGARPARTGIIANNWRDPQSGRDIYCAEDSRLPRPTPQSYTVSPYHLRVPALGDLMRRADPRSRAVAVAGKDRSAVMMGGHEPAARWWWAGRAFASHGGVAATPAVAAVNADVARQLARPARALPLPALCDRLRRSIAVPGGQEVGLGLFARAADDASGYRATPAFDEATLALAAGLRREMRLGEGEAPDLLAISLAATDYVGHSLGTQGAEMCIQLLALDRALGRFLQQLDRTRIDYVVALTADHGGLDLPERANDQAGQPSARVDAALPPSVMGQAIGRRLGLQGPVLFGDGPFGDLYVDRALPAADQQRARTEALRAYRAHPQVEAVFTREELAAAPPPSGPPDRWTLLERARASFDAERSGDLVVLLRPRVTPISDPGRGYVATHGSPWDYDRRVPILFWGRDLSPFEQPLPVETVDIMPTLAALIGLAIAPGSIDGRCLDLRAGLESTCPAQ